MSTSPKIGNWTCVVSSPRLCRPNMNPKVSAICKIIFCASVRPRLRCLTTLMKSSRKPMRPEPNARNSTSIPACNCGIPSTSGSLGLYMTQTMPSVARVPRIKQRPPMVGVPFFLLCHVGPSSRMVWPKCSRCSAGIMNLPATAVMAKPPTAAAASRDEICSMPLIPPNVCWGAYPCGNSL